MPRAAPCAMCARSSAADGGRFERYVKVTFFRGAQLAPPPPGPSKQPQVRYLDIREQDAIDEDRLADRVRQAAALPGEKL